MDSCTPPFGFIPSGNPQPFVPCAPGAPGTGCAPFCPPVFNGNSPCPPQVFSVGPISFLQPTAPTNVPEGVLWSDSTPGHNSKLYRWNGLSFDWLGLSSSGQYATNVFSVDVTAFGADPTGANDSTSKIQAAINACPTGGSVYFPAGTYTISGTINLTQSNRTIVGFGATIKPTSVPTFHLFQANSLVGLRITGLIFDGDFPSGTGVGLTYGLLALTGCSNVYVADCTFQNCNQVGIWMLGANTNIQVIGNTFQNFFCGIFSNWDGVNPSNQLQGSVIAFNGFYNGNASTGTNFSGAIKLAGNTSFTSSNVKSGNVIANNTIFSPGQMGVELNGGANNSTVVGNSIYGSGFGISFASMSGGLASGNVVNACVSYGLEVAANAANCTLDGNLLDGRNGSGTASPGIGMSIVYSTNTTVTGGSVQGYATGMYAQDSGGPVVGLNVSGVTFGRPYTSTPGGQLNIKSISNFSFKGCHFIGTAADTYDFITLDNTDANISNGVISNCVFSGACAQQGISIYIPGTNLIQYVRISDNDTSAVTSWGASGAAIQLTGTNAQANTQACRVMNNTQIGNASGIGASAGFNLYSYTPNFNATQPFWQGIFEGCTIEYDCSGGAKSWQMFSAVGVNGYEVTFVKSDSSGNALTLTTSSSQTISGKNGAGAYVSSTSYVMSGQGTRATLRSDGANWVLLDTR